MSQNRAATRLCVNALSPLMTLEEWTEVRTEECRLLEEPVIARGFGRPSVKKWVCGERFHRRSDRRSPFRAAWLWVVLQPIPKPIRYTTGMGSLRRLASCGLPRGK